MVQPSHAGAATPSTVPMGIVARRMWWLARLHTGQGWAPHGLIDRPPRGLMHVLRVMERP